MSDIPHIIQLSNRVTLRIRRPRLPQHLHSFLERQPQRFLQKQEILTWELLFHRLNLMLEFRLQTTEDVDEHIVEDIDSFVVMLFNSHFEIETHEFSHVAVSIGVFGSEYYLLFVSLTLLIVWLTQPGNEEWGGAKKKTTHQGQSHKPSPYHPQ